MWSDIRRYANANGHDDMFQRLHIMASMVLVVGFASNASAITIEREDGHYQFGPGGQSATNSAFGFLTVALAMRACRQAVYGFLLPNFRRAYLYRGVEVRPLAD